MSCTISARWIWIQTWWLGTKHLCFKGLWLNPSRSIILREVCCVSDRISDGNVSTKWYNIYYNINGSGSRWLGHLAAGAKQSMLTRTSLDHEVSFFSGILDPQLGLWVQRKIWLLCFGFFSVRQQNKSACQSIFNEQLSLDFSIPSLFVLFILTRWYSLFKVQQSHIITSTQTCQETEAIKKSLSSIYLRSQKASCSKLIDLLTM